MKWLKWNVACFLMCAMVDGDVSMAAFQSHEEAEQLTQILPKCAKVAKRGKTRAPTCSPSTRPTFEPSQESRSPSSSPSKPRDWANRVKLTASDGAEGARFGIFVSLSEDTLLVGASHRTIASSYGSYIFEKDYVNGSWEQKAKLPAPVIGNIYKKIVAFGNSVSENTIDLYEKNETSGHWEPTGSLINTCVEYGAVVGIWENTIIVGCAREGSHIYERNTTNSPWEETFSAYYGRRYFGGVDISENVAAIWFGSSIYVYERNTTSGTWAETAKLFGVGQGNVAISENVIVAGDSHDDLGKGSYTGSAYVFERDSSGSWFKKMKLTASDGKRGDYFGRSVAISGGTMVVGSNGAIYVFKKNETTGLWVETVKLSDSISAGSYLFGWSVSISENVIAVGSPHDSENGYQKGSVFILD